MRLPEDPAPSLCILALDPSIACTGYAVLREAPARPDQGEVVDGGVIETKADTAIAARLAQLYHETGAKIRGSYRDHGTLTGIVVEFPACHPRGPADRSFARSALSLPVYGMAVGVVLAVVTAELDLGGEGTAWVGGECALLTPGSDEWLTRDIPRPPRGVKDPNKEARARYVRQLYGLDLGPKSKAGNVADAILMARWAMWRMRPVDLHLARETPR